MSTFRDLFKSHLPSGGAVWEVEGILSKGDQVYALGYDTKLLSTVFELVAAPIVELVALNLGYAFEVSQSQTIYPDFTLSGLGGDRIAVDIKTTYRRRGRGVQFTLGSYTSFLRNGTKNIAHPYGEYVEHWIIGFVYDRRVQPTIGIVPLSQRSTIVPPVENVELVMARKEWIASDRPGSGNTANVGSVIGSVEYLNAERGPFSGFPDPRVAFHEYWRGFRSPAEQRDGIRTYSNLAEFNEWQNRPSDT